MKKSVLQTFDGLEPRVRGVQYGTACVHEFPRRPEDPLLHPCVLGRDRPVAVLVAVPRAAKILAREAAEHRRRYKVALGRAPRRHLIRCEVEYRHGACRRGARQVLADANREADACGATNARAPRVGQIGQPALLQRALSRLPFLSPVPVPSQQHHGNARTHKPRVEVARRQRSHRNAGYVHRTSVEIWRRLRRSDLPMGCPSSGTSLAGSVGRLF